MWSLLITCVLASGPEASVEVRTTSPESFNGLRQNLQTGSLIFCQGDCLAVRIFSASKYTHVAGVVIEQEQAIVYDSMNGTGVRKTALDEYLRLQTPCEILVAHPRQQMTAEQALAYETHLKRQLGRQYAIKHHLTGMRCEGLHCAEYLTDALIAAKMIHAQTPSRVSPGSLWEGLRTSNLYAEGDRYRLKAVEMPPVPNLTWCQRAWLNTQACCSKTASQLSRWILCR